MPITSLVSWMARLTVLAAVLVLVLLARRDVSRRSRRAGWFLALGVAGRLLLASTLFFVSYLEVPVLVGLQAGDGFWALAPDARVYFQAAVAGLQGGVLPPNTPSPGFVWWLAAWMWLVGSSPAAAALLNTLFYVATCWVLVRLLPDDQVAADVAVFAFTASPSLVFFGTQALKDAFFAGVVAATCAAAWKLIGPSRLRSVLGPATLCAGAGVLAGLALASSVRTYYAVFLCGGLAVALLGRAIFTRRTGTLAGRTRTLARTAVALAWIALAWGVVAHFAGARYDTLAWRLVAGTAGPPPGVEASLPAKTVEALDEARGGFLRSGGATNAANATVARDVPGRLRTVAEGSLLVFVPVAVLRPLGLVTFSGGRGLTGLADLDTLFTGASLLALGLLAWRRWRQGRLNVPYALFVVLVAGTTALALAYVVTNFGTLFRLRLMVSVPGWMLALAMARPGGPAERPGGVAA